MPFVTEVTYLLTLSGPVESKSFPTSGLTIVRLFINRFKTDFPSSFCIGLTIPSSGVRGIVSLLFESPLPRLSCLDGDLS